jgi:hypothetical protein
MADCNRCTSGVPDVPYFVHESEMARLERANRRLWIAVMVLAAALSASVLGWMIHAENAPVNDMQEVYLHGTEGFDTA